MSTWRSWRRLTALVVAGAVGPTSVGLAPAPAAAGITCSVSVSDASVIESDSGTTSMVFTLTRNPVGFPITVQYVTRDDTAVADQDYTPVLSGVTFGASSATAAVPVAVIGDTVGEPDETFFLDLILPSPCTITDNRGVGTILDDSDPIIVVDPIDAFIPSGYRLTALDGGVFAYGNSTYVGSANTLPGLVAPVIDIDETWNRAGYWQVAVDGGVFAWNAPFFGSAAGFTLAAPVLGAAIRPQDDGYWLVGQDGGVFAFGNAPFLGSAAGMDGVVVIDIVATITGRGYWLLDAGGAVFPFGDAVDFGDHEARDVEVVGMAVTPGDGGYWITNIAGNVFQFGNATDHGEIENPESLNGSIADIASIAVGSGYWLVGLDGGVFAFNAPFYGSAGSLPLVAPVVAIAGKH